MKSKDRKKASESPEVGRKAKQKKRSKARTIKGKRDADQEQHSTRTLQAKAVGSFPIVGVGASAGGLEAFTELLKHLPTDTGLGFVLVQHLDPQHESALPQLLTRATSMPVREITDNLRVEPNHVYVIPPNTGLGIEQGILKFRPRPRTRTPIRSIDAFFESLSEDQRERAIGVILSGTASDGTLGLEAIKAEGGITFAQDKSARYDSMPRSAIAAGCVDFVLAPEEIAKELARIALHPYVAGRQEDRASAEEERAFATRHEDDERSFPSGGRGMPLPGARELKAAKIKTGGNGFKKIVLLLRDHCGVDFSLYKSATIQRRITRRMVLNKQNTLEGYASFLRGNIKELDALYSDALISVTSFFRNPEGFDFLKRDVFPKLLQQRGGHPVRVWVLGCSTGQEAYSMAMAFTEAADTISRPRKLQVFATDLNEALLDKARQGLYAKTLADDISPERLRRFFVEEEAGYRIIKPLRELVIFARQNLIGDPPFSRMDLISCRNLLIYLEPELQKKVIPTFHYALKPEGFLFLGASESIGSYTDLFQPADKKHKIYSRRAAPTPSFHLPVRQDRDEKPSPGVKAQPPARKGQDRLPHGLHGELNAQREADRVTVNQFAPPGVLINADLQILQFRGATEAFLQPPPSGKATFDLLKMAREGLMLPLRAAINRARKENKTARKENVRLQQNGKTRLVNLEVIPLRNLQERCFLVLFEEAKSRKPSFKEPIANRGRAIKLSPAGRKQKADRIDALETELSETRDYLQSIQEQHEASNEELQASNEEIQSANEELQSINEELETSKEELESTNEELTTVNEEMASRNIELNRLNADLRNLQSSIKLPVVLLGRDLIIRSFSAPAEKVFSLFATDVGRPLSSVRHNLIMPPRQRTGEWQRAAQETAPYPLEELVFEVIDTIQEREEQVCDKEGRWYSLRARPYMTLDNKVDGAVLVLVDITSLKRFEKELKTARDYAEMTLRASPVPLLVLHEDLRIQSANAAFYRVFKTGANETEGRLIYELGNGQWNIPKLRDFLEDIIPRKSFFNDFMVTHEFPGIGQRSMLLSGRRLEEHEEVPERIFLAIEDITPLVEAQADIRISEQRFRRLFETARDGILLVDPVSRRITDSNPYMSTLAGRNPEELIGKELWEIGLIPGEQASRDTFRQLQERGFVRYESSPFTGKTGEIRQVEIVANLYQENGKKVIQCNVRDVTERRHAEEEVRTAKDALQEANYDLEQRTISLQESNVKSEDLSKRLVKAQEDERARIARELHDEMGQALTGLKLFIRQVQENVTPEGFTTIQAMLSEIMQQNRQMSLDLHPLVLDDLGLKAALDWHCKTYSERTKIQVHFECGEIPEKNLSPEIEITLFRLVQEALTNVAKHAHVDHAKVQLFVQDNAIHLEIHDSGKGFEVAALNRNVSFGLPGMRERVTLLGGTFRVESSPGRGTSIYVTLPMSSGEL